MRIILIILLLFGIYQAFLPYMADAGRTVTQAEVDRYSAGARLVNDEAVIRSIDLAQKPTVIMIYASWCRYCNMQLPGMKEIWQEGGFAPVNLMFLSIDSELSKLSAYLLRKEFDGMIGAPMILKSHDGSALKDALAMRGGRFSGGVPYMAFIDSKGQVVSELTGFASRSTMRDHLGQLK